MFRGIQRELLEQYKVAMAMQRQLSRRRQHHLDRKRSHALVMGLVRRFYRQLHLGVTDAPPEPHNVLPNGMRATSQQELIDATREHHRKWRAMAGKKPMMFAEKWHREGDPTGPAIFRRRQIRPGAMCKTCERHANRCGRRQTT